MSTFIDALRTGHRLLWLDTSQYAARLLLRGGVPWLDAAGYLAWQRKAQSLLSSDVIALPLLELATAWVQAHEGISTTMRAKRRNVFPLQSLLADTHLREHVASLVSDLRAAFADRLLAVTLPTPRGLLKAAYALAHGPASTPEVEADEAEAAAMYGADFLRILAGAGIDILLLEALSTAPITLEDASFEPLSNLARHYRWSVGIRGCLTDSRGDGCGVDFAITAAALTGLTHGIEIDRRFWSDAAVPVIPPASFWFAQVPADAAPERVLERLGMLRMA